MKDYCIELPLFLPPFPVAEETETTAHCPQPVVRRKTNKGLTSAAKMNEPRQDAPTIEAELGKLEQELATSGYRDMFQLAQLQHHHERCASQLPVRESLSRLETALCQVIRSHNHKLVMQNMVTSQHQQIAPSSSVIQGDALDALLKPTFNPHYLQAIDQVVHNMDNWIGSCLRKHVPFGDEIASLEVGDLVWVYPAAVAPAVLSSSITTASSAFIHSPFNPDLLRKHGWRKCVVLAIKGDLHFPRFIKVRPVVTATREAVFGMFPTASKLLHRQLSVHMAQWIAVETGIVRVDIEAYRARREKTAAQQPEPPSSSSSEILSETQSEATLTDHVLHIRTSHVDVIELTSSSSASPDTVITIIADTPSTPAGSAVSPAVKEAPAEAIEAMRESSVAFEQPSAVAIDLDDDDDDDDAVTPQPVAADLPRKRPREEETPMDRPSSDGDVDDAKRRKGDVDLSSASPTTTTNTATTTATTTSTSSSDAAGDAMAVDPLPAEQPTSSTVVSVPLTVQPVPTPAVQPAASRPPTVNYHSALNMFSSARLTMKPTTATFRIGSKGKVVANNSAE